LCFDQVAAAGVATVSALPAAIVAIISDFSFILPTPVCKNG
jgi:hypothetical protein